MLGQSGALDVAGCARGGLRAFGEDDVARHERLPGFEVIADALVDCRKLRRAAGGVVDRRLARGASRRCTDCGQRLRDRFNQGGDFRHPEVRALSRSDVRLLGRAQLGQRVARFARALIEGAHGRAVRRDLPFGVEDESGGPADCKPRYRAQCESRRT